MDFKSKKGQLIILGLTSIVLARTMLVLFKDPEGPNLLIVLGMAVIVYAPSIAVYFFGSVIKDHKKFLFAILVQIVIVSGFYFCLN